MYIVYKTYMYIVYNTYMFIVYCVQFTVHCTVGKLRSSLTIHGWLNYFSCATEIDFNHLSIAS